MSDYPKPPKWYVDAKNREVNDLVTACEMYRRRIAELEATLISIKGCKHTYDCDCALIALEAKEQ